MKGGGQVGGGNFFLLFKRIKGINMKTPIAIYGPYGNDTVTFKWMTFGKTKNIKRESRKQAIDNILFHQIKRITINNTYYYLNSESSKNAYNKKYRITAQSNQSVQNVVSLEIEIIKEITDNSLLQPRYTVHFETDQYTISIYKDRSLLMDKYRSRHMDKYTIGYSYFNGFLVNKIKNNDVNNYGSIFILSTSDDSLLSHTLDNVSEYKIGDPFYNDKTYLIGIIVAIVATTGQYNRSGIIIIDKNRKPLSQWMETNSTEISSIYYNRDYINEYTLFTHDEFIDRQYTSLVPNGNINIERTDIEFDGLNSTISPYNSRTIDYLKQIKKPIIFLLINENLFTIGDKQFKKRCYLGKGAFGEVCLYTHEHIYLAKKETRGNSYNKIASKKLDTSSKKQYVIPYIFTNNIVLMPIIIPLDKFIRSYTPQQDVKIQILKQIIFNLYKLAEEPNSLYYTDLKLENIGIMKYREGLIRCYLIDIGSLTVKGETIIRPNFVNTAKTHIKIKMCQLDITIPKNKRLFILKIGLNYLIFGNNGISSFLNEPDEQKLPEFSIFKQNEKLNIDPIEYDDAVSLYDYYKYLIRILLIPY